MNNRESNIARGWRYSQQSNLYLKKAALYSLENPLILWSCQPLISKGSLADRDPDLSYGARELWFWHQICRYLTNRFHVAVRLFSNRSQMTSKCRKNKDLAHEPQASVSLLFLPHFDVLCDLLLNRPTATWNLFVLYNNQKRKRPIHIPASNRLTFWGFVLV